MTAASFEGTEPCYQVLEVRTTRDKNWHEGVQEVLDEPAQLVPPCSRVDDCQHVLEHCDDGACLGSFAHFYLNFSFINI